MQKKYLLALTAILLYGLLAGGVSCNYDTPHGPGCWRDDAGGADELLKGWYSKTVDSVDDAGLYSSIAIDSEDEIHISYIRIDVVPGGYDDDDDCYDNHPPELLTAHYFVEGQEFSPPVVIAPEESVDLGIYFEYADVDCNLPGGHFYNNINDEGWNDFGVLPEELGCSSADSGLLYGFGFSEGLDVGAYTGQTRWTDVCGEESNVLEWEFTVSDADDDDDSRDTPVRNDGDSWEYVYYLMRAEAAAGQSDWVVRRIKHLSGWAKETAIAAGPDGHVHISYCWSSSYHGAAVMYATSATQWGSHSLIEDVGSYGSCDTSIALYSDALHSGGIVHIAYGSDDGLKYVVGSFDDWEIYTVDAAKDELGGHVALALDSSGGAHVSYYNSAKGDLLYATNATGEWRTFTIDSDGDVGRDGDIAVDSSGNVHMSYYDYGSGDLKYATNASGRWETYRIDSAGVVGAFTSIALDSTGSVHISYYDATKGALKYAENAYGAWRTFTVDSRGDTGYYTSIAVDSYDFVHISYFNSSADSLMYVTNRPSAVRE